MLCLDGYIYSLCHKKVYGSISIMCNLEKIVYCVSRAPCRWFPPACEASTRRRRRCRDNGPRCRVDGERRRAKPVERPGDEASRPVVKASAPSPSADSHAIGNHLHGARGAHTVFCPTGGNDLRNGYEEGCGAATGPGRSPGRDAGVKPLPGG